MLTVLRWLVMATALGLASSCSVYSTSPLPPGLRSTVETAERGDDLYLVVILNPSSDQPRKACGRFKLPTLDPLPEIPDIPEKMRDNDEAIANYLIDHIVEIRKHNNKQQYQIKEAYEDYLSDCR